MAKVNGTVPLVFCWLLFFSAHALAQQSPVRVPGVNEPPELTGEAEKRAKPPEAFLELFTVFPKDSKDSEEVKRGIAKLTRLLEQNPDWSDAYYLRALFDRCMLQASDYEATLKDIDGAISTSTSKKFPRIYTVRVYYSLRAQTNFRSGHFREAIGDIDAAIKQDLATASNVFSSSKKSPATNVDPCEWSKSDFDVSVQRFPKDHRPYIYRGLYLASFMVSSPEYYPQAMKEIQAAISIAPRAAEPQFYIGYLYAQFAFWTKAADAVKEEAKRKSLLAYTKAIQLDPKFTAAYRARGDAYFENKQYPQAIRDFDRVLELEREDIHAYWWRGVARMNRADYYGAILDFGEASRRLTADDSFPRRLDAYAARADAYMKVGAYRNVVADLTKAIQELLGRVGQSFTLQQWRTLYPEYNSVSDEAFVRRLNALFWPDAKYEETAKQLGANEDRSIGAFVIELYEKRGDAYLRIGDFEAGVRDFRRIGNAVDRWRSLGTTTTGTYYLDVKTVQFPNSGGYARIWLKTTTKSATSVDAFDIDCRGKRLSQTSTVVYSPDGKVLRSSDSTTGWTSIVPDTFGEQLHSGLCRG